MKLAITSTISFTFFLMSCVGSSRVEPYEETRFLMDTVVKIAVYNSGFDEEQIREAVQKAFSTMSAVEQKTTAHSDSSEVGTVNRKAGESDVEVSDDTFQIIKTALDVARESDGAFDVTVAPLNRLWGFYEDRMRVPDDSEIARSLKYVDNTQVHMKENKVYLSRRGMSLDLGGLAKGAVVDGGIEVLREAGISSGIIDAGGDLRLFGKHPSRGTWRIGVKHPRREGRIYCVLETGASAIATSGDYERYFIENGVRYHHILDPRTGYPSTKCISVTIVAPTAILADAYATAVFVLGPEEGLKLIESKPELEGLIIYGMDDALIHVVSTGLGDHITLVHDGRD